MSVFLKTRFLAIVAILLFGGALTWQLSVSGQTPASPDTAAEETRPVLSALNAVDQARSAVSEIRDKARQLISECSDTPPLTQGGILLESGPFTSMAGKHLQAPPWKLKEIDQSIKKQQCFLSETLSENQQDTRPLRASEKTRQQIKDLRAEARTSLAQMIVEANGLSTLVSSSYPNQDAVITSARVLAKSADAVDEKLKEMDKVLKKAKK